MALMLAEVPNWVNDSQRQFITIKEACGVLGVCRDTLYRYIEVDDLPVKKIPSSTSKNRNSYKIPKHKFLKWAGFTTEGK